MNEISEKKEKRFDVAIYCTFIIHNKNKCLTEGTNSFNEILLLNILCLFSCFLSFCKSVLTFKSIYILNSLLKSIFVLIYHAVNALAFQLSVAIETLLLPPLHYCCKLLQILSLI